jgi:hypothetical protein
MKKQLVIAFLTFISIIACTNRDGEIIDLINSVKKQNDDLKAQITALKKTTDSALVAVLKVNSLQLATEKKIDIIQTDLKALLTQIASLTTQMTAANADLVSLKARIDVLQAKCAELVDQITFLNGSSGTINMNKGLAISYNFNGNLNDEVANSINAVLSGGIYSTDRKNNQQNSLELKQPLGFIKSNGILSNIVNDFTISIWANSLNDAKLINQSIELASILDWVAAPPLLHPTHGSNWGDPTLNSGVGIYFGKNQIQIVEHSDNYVGFPLTYSGSFSGWTHIVLVYEGHIPKLYVNGQFVKSGLITKFKYVHPSNGVDKTSYANYSTSGIGRAFSPQNESITSAIYKNFEGKIDDFKIWNRVLTNSEIDYLYKN